MLQEGKNIGVISKRRQAASPGLELSHVMVHDGEQYSPCLIVLEPECSRIEEVSSPSQTANSQVDVTVEIAPIKAISQHSPRFELLLVFFCYLLKNRKTLDSALNR